MKTLTILLCLVLSSCQISKNDSIDAQSPDYKAYMAQQHRFALNGCELSYNKKPFRLGMTLQEAEQVFGG
ncbi:MAG: hypothetical protein JKY08_02430 [Flavobacteriaceae bacterium]|nr:hypothetical protein [Flavobacteriaceae bacterium]